MFGEEPSRTQPDAFFGLFTDFLDAFAAARKDNIAMKQKKLEEEKRKQKEEEVNPTGFLFFYINLRYLMTTSCGLCFYIIFYRF